MGTFVDLIRNGFSVTEDSTNYMMNKFRPKGFSYEQIVTMAMARERTKENKAFEKYEHSFAKKEYRAGLMIEIFDIIEMGYNPDEYICTGMTEKEIVEVKKLLMAKEKDGIRDRIQRLRDEAETSGPNIENKNKQKDFEIEK